MKTVRPAKLRAGGESGGKREEGSGSSSRFRFIVRAEMVK